MRHAYVCAFLPDLPDLTLSTDTNHKGKNTIATGFSGTKENARDVAACKAMYLVIRLLKAITALRYLVIPFQQNLELTRH